MGRPMCRRGLGPADVDVKLQREEELKARAPFPVEEMALITSCWCFSLLVGAIASGVYATSMYLVAFGMELWWLVESEDGLPAPAYLLCLGYLSIFFISITLLGGLAGRRMNILLAWLFFMVLFLFPECGMVLFMSLYHWKLDSHYGLAELVFYICRAALNLLSVICVQSLYATWREEKLVLTRLRELNVNMVSVVVSPTTTGTGFGPAGKQQVHHVRGAEDLGDGDRDRDRNGFGFGMSKLGHGPGRTPTMMGQQQAYYSPSVGAAVELQIGGSGGGIPNKIPRASGRGSASGFLRQVHVGGGRPGTVSSLAYHQQQQHPHQHQARHGHGHGHHSEFDASVFSDQYSGFFQAATIPPRSHSVLGLSSTLAVSAGSQCYGYGGEDPADELYSRSKRVGRSGSSKEARALGLGIGLGLEPCSTQSLDRRLFLGSWRQRRAASMDALHVRHGRGDPGPDALLAPASGRRRGSRGGGGDQGHEYDYEYDYVCDLYGGRIPRRRLQGSLSSMAQSAESDDVKQYRDVAL